MNNKIQIAIVAKTINKELLNLISAQLPMHEIIVISPEANKINNTINIKYYHDDDFLNKANFIDNSHHERPGWLYQQFLKYQIVLKSNCKNTLILDGDTFLINPKFLIENCLYYTPKKIESKYNLFILNTLGQNYCTNKNYITNQMMFNKKLLMEMICENFDSIENYYKKISEKLEINPGWEFSEYQTYASWSLVKSKPLTEKIKIFRRLDLVSKNHIESLKKYDIVAQEYNHKSGLLRKLRANFLFLFGLNLG
jgi:hypothetical protein